MTTRQPTRHDYLMTIERAKGRPTNKQLRAEAKAARKALKEMDAMNTTTDRTAIEITCAACGDVVMVPPDENPEDTLCVACAEDEQNQ